MPFPLEDNYWIQARDTLKQYAQPLDSILAPNEFLEFFPGSYHYNITYLLPPEQFKFVLFHKAMVHDLDPKFALKVQQTFKPIWGNEVFVLYAQHPLGTDLEVPNAHLQPLLDQLAAIEAEQELKVKPPKYAVTVTTYNRPESLARSLPQILALGAPLVVVDDASTAENYERNRRITEEHGVTLIRIPENRGLPNAINVGISHWLADPQIDWISYFQDDVEVRPDLLRVLEQVQDADSRPILTGYDAAEHQTFGSQIVNGYEVLLKRSTSGVHLHAHRKYWQAVLPIPTPYLGAPKPDRGKDGQGADEDWWITAWSPHAITKRGGYVVCVPGLVQTFDRTGENSTWQNLVAAPQDSDPTSTGVVALATVKTESQFIPTEVNVTPSDLAGKLAGVKVLVDGYNLQSRTGTGIKTYGTTLVQALQCMGAQVDVLLSRNANRKDPLLDEVFLFDDMSYQRGKLGDTLDLLKSIIQSSAGPYYRAWRRKSIGHLVLKKGRFREDLLKYARSLNLPRCYEVAEANFTLFNHITNISLPKNEKIDIWHATIPMPIRIRGAKASITTVHDLIPLRLPYTTLDNKKTFYSRVKHALKESSLVIAVSEHTKKDLLTYFDVDPDRIFVTYQPIALSPLYAEPEKVNRYLQRYKLQYQNYLLFVGAIEPKKNVGRLLEAYAQLDTDMPLVIVGKKAWLWEEDLGKTSYLFDKDSHRRVKFLEYVPSESLRYLYRGAYCFVFPSLYEGFGLPTIEAMTMGCPVITSTASCLPEICGTAALYTNPYDADELKQRLEQILSDRTLRDQLAEAGLQVAQNFSMEKYLYRLYSAYQKALGL